MGNSERTPRGCAWERFGVERSGIIIIRADNMALTRNFNETIRARVERDPKFRKELLREGIESMLAGDIATAKTFCVTTSTRPSASPNSRMRPISIQKVLCVCSVRLAIHARTTSSRFVSFLQHREGVRFQVKTAPEVR